MLICINADSVRSLYRGVKNIRNLRSVRKLGRCGVALGNDPR